VDKKLLENSMQKLQKGNVEALDSIYDLTSKAVYYLCFSILKNSEQAKDIAHDTYIRLYKNINRYELNTNAAAWILSIARNLSLNEYAKLKHTLSLEGFKEDLIDAREHFSDVDDFCYMNKTFQVLNPDEREIVILFAMNRFKHYEIAEIVNKPTGTVKWIYNRAVKKLREKIKAEPSNSETNKKEHQVLKTSTKLKKEGKQNER